MTTPSQDPPTDGDPGLTPGLTRVTFNTTARARTALTTVMTASGTNQTDAINGALRITATLVGLVWPDGTVHVLAPDGTTHILHLP